MGNIRVETMVNMIICRALGILSRMLLVRCMLLVVLHAISEVHAASSADRLLVRCMLLVVLIG